VFEARVMSEELIEKGREKAGTISSKVKNSK